MPISVPGRIAEVLRRSTASIRSDARSRGGSGCGVVLPNDRLVTNAHVVQDKRTVSVESWEGKRVTAQIVRMDRHRDLALLSAAGLDAPAMQFGDSDQLRAGTPVVAIGNPLGFTGAVSSGVVHTPSASLNGMYQWICADVRLAPGNSGGPLADLQGRMIGINTMVVRGGLALAVPSRSIQAFLAAENHPVKLGATLRPVTLRNRKPGMMILGLESGGSADNASLFPGDILVAGNGRELHFLDDLQRSINDASGSSYKLDFYRGGEQQLRHVVVQLAKESVTAAA